MTFKRFLALILTLLMVVSMLPAVHAAENADEDIWAQISAFEDDALAKRSMGAKAVPTAADFAALSEDVERLVVRSGDCMPGSVIRHGSFFYWTSADGEVCGYSPRLRAKMHAASVVPDADPEALSGIETVSYAVKGGSPGSANVAVFQPYRGLDSSFTNQYPEEGKRIAQALGGTGTTYKTTAATVDQVAKALEDCAVVIFDSHGDTDYVNPRNTDDYVTGANTSYLCMQTNAGWSDEDTKAVEGPYGTYYHAYNAGSYGSMRYYCADGTVFANHMQKPACNNLLWMAICLGMATDGMFRPLHDKGVEVVYGYSQSVSFSGDYEYEEYFWDRILDGYTAGEAFAYMKEQAGCDWDPAYKGYNTLAKARYNFVAFPNVVSSEDEFQGHRTVNPKSANDSTANKNNDPAYGACNIQTVRSVWTLLQQFTVTSFSNNEDWGAVSVLGSTITASPHEGYYTAGYEVVSGAAEVTQRGNVFTVKPESDCTVRIDFAAKTPATVRFVTPEGVSCESVSTYVSDEIAMPAPTGAPTADAQSYRFLGWTTQTVDDTDEKPVYYAAGNPWTVEAEDAVFYALYGYTVASGAEEGVFPKLEQAPADWCGEYVITYNGHIVLDASGRYTGTKLGSINAAVALNDTGMRLEDGVLYDVPDEYVYVIERSPAFSGNYVIRMKGSDNYVAFKSSSASLTTGDDPSNIYSLWEPSMTGDTVSVWSVVASSYSLQYNATAGAFCCSQSKLKNLTLFTRPLDSVFYTTELKNACEHDYAAAVTAPTCTEQGYTTYTCSKCGDTYVGDYVDALGHTPAEPVRENEVAPTCTEPGGYDAVVYCAVCGEELSRTFTDLPATGHDWNEPVYAWAVDYSAVAAIRTCKNDKSHVETEDGVITSEVTREATIDAAGEIVYTATFTNPAFETQTVKIAVPKLDDGLPCDGGESCPGVRFTDMPAKGNWAHDPIDWAVVHGVTSGTSATTFSPNAGCTRAQVVTFLWRAAGSPEPAAAVSPFKDTAEDAYYYKAVLWAVENEITAGTSVTTFSPEATCTRAQIVTFLWRYEGAPEPTAAANPFQDVAAGAYFAKAVLWASENGVTAGTSATAFSPDDTCTRAHVVTFLYRDVEK
ncbi:MAG: S-layer homology domain-containing protein [Oscillospiraceae bacterium]|nr:S-layer homology domain-containing protein [Oscillospiraceae bacterium]